jgi:hypothetical protein
MFRKKEVNGLFEKYIRINECGNNTKIYFKLTGIEGVIWIHLAQDMGQ